MSSSSRSRACDFSFSSGEILHIHEVISGKECEGKSVKILGKLNNHKPLQHQASLELDGHSINVDTSNLSGIVLLEGTLYHLIGEVQNSRLVARVVCDATGLDVALWKEALEVRRVFLAEEGMSILD
jgi:hypothetical protein